MKASKSFFHRTSSSLVPLAVAGLLAGLSACGDNKPAETHADKAATEAKKAESSAKEATKEAGKAASAAAAEKHSCKGLNSCKGTGGCKTGDNGCKGKNSCKGKGGCEVK
jgi:hypothetical protein